MQSARFPGISDFVIDYCMLTAFAAHAIPLTDRMFEFLKSQKIVEPDQQAQLISQMLARHIPAKEAYNFYCAASQRIRAAGSKKAGKKFRGKG